jgi:Rod binding domain-containing protein
MDAGLQNIGDMAVTQSTASSAISMASKIGSGPNIDKAAKNFESMFMSQMLAPMFETDDVDPMFGGGHGEQVMRTFLVQEYGKIAANSGNLGIASAVKAEMIRAQSAASGQSKTASSKAASKAYAPSDTLTGNGALNASAQ